LSVANVGEGSAEVPPAIAAHAAAQGAEAVAVSARLEAELGELSDEDAAAMRADLGLAESGLQTVVRGAFSLLHLVAFFTAGEDKPAQSWHLRRGLSVWHAAGLIHSDIQKGFVRAEVISWDALVDAGGYAGARDRGTLRLEGRDYVMGDGDVITVKFTPEVVQQWLKPIGHAKGALPENWFEERPGVLRRTGFPRRPRVQDGDRFVYYA